LSSQQGEKLFELLGRKPRFSHVPVALLDSIIWGLGAAGAFSPNLRNKAEFARIGRYYATESMLVWNKETRHYSRTTPR
jgi:divinyl chlorophyllide a 8-vinyl-reductase